MLGAVLGDFHHRVGHVDRALEDAFDFVAEDESVFFPWRRAEFVEADRIFRLLHGYYFIVLGF